MLRATLQSGPITHWSFALRKPSLHMCVCDGVLPLDWCHGLHLLSPCHSPTSTKVIACRLPKACLKPTTSATVNGTRRRELDDSVRDVMCAWRGTLCGVWLLGTDRLLAVAIMCGCFDAHFTVFLPAIPLLRRDHCAHQTTVGPCVRSASLATW